jgi:hypothetical protein
MAAAVAWRQTVRIVGARSGRRCVGSAEATMGAWECSIRHCIVTRVCVTP